MHRAVFSFFAGGGTGKIEEESGLSFSIGKSDRFRDARCRVVKGKKKFWEDETGPAEFESEDDEKIP